VRPGWAAWTVEAGFVPTTPGYAGTVLILGDVTLGLLGTGTLATDGIWTDISPWVQEFSIDRPGSRQQGPIVSYDAGTATVTLNNSDARFTPGNLAGPYVAAGVTQIRPMIPLRISATWNNITYRLFTGYISTWLPPAEDMGPGYAITTVSATDGQRILEGVQIPETAAVGGGELSGARVNRVLTAANWYGPGRGLRDIDTGQSTLQGTTYGASALSVIAGTVLSEIGEFYISGAGVAVFRDRNAPLADTRSNTVQAVFGDRPGTGHPAGTEVAYVALSNPTDDTTLANDVQATADGPTFTGTMQEAIDATSVATYTFARTYEATVALQSDSEALQWANYVLYIGRNDETRFDELTLLPVAAPDSLWPQALGRELGDRVQVWRRPPGMASALTQDVFIRGIYHTVTVDGWQTVWTLSAATRYSFFTLGNTTLGVLGANALAY